MTGLADRPRRPTHRWGAAVRQGWGGSPQPWPLSQIWTLVWLLYLIYPPLLDDTAPAWVFALGIAVALLYAAFYLVVLLRPSQLRRWADVVTTVLAVLVTPLTAGGAVLLVYAAGHSGSNRPRRVALRWYVGLTLIVVGFAVVSPIPLPWRLFAFAPPAVLIWVIGLICMEAAADDRASKIRNAQVEHLATVAERERIARDLHDLLGQTLTGIVVRSQLAQRLVAVDPDAGRAEMAAVEQAARAALTEVRATVSGWRQVDLGVELAAARDALGAAGVELVVQRDPDLVLT